MKRRKRDYGRHMEAVRELRGHEPPKNSYGLKELDQLGIIYVS